MQIVARACLFSFIVGLSLLFVGASPLDSPTNPGGNYAIFLALVIWLFRYLFLPEDRAEWPARRSRATRIALNLSFCALAVQMTSIYQWIHSGLYEPHATAYLGWILVAGLPIVAVVFSARALAFQLRSTARQLGSAILSVVLSCWAIALAFDMIREVV